MSDVIVVGAGIVGASVAYHAALRGAEVLLLDRSEPGSGVTADSFAWVRDGSEPLRSAARGDWARLEREVPGVRVRWSGSLTWGGEPDPDARIVEADEIARLEPNLRAPPPRAAFRPTDGAVDPVAVTRALVDAARAHGAQVRTSEPVLRLYSEGDAVAGVETPHGTRAARVVVLAAGVGATSLCAGVGVELPVAPSPAVLVRFDAPPGLVRTLVSGPDIEVRQDEDGSLLAAEAYTGDDLQRTAQDALQRLRRAFTGAEDARIVDVRAGARPMPADGRPIMGFVRPGAYVAVMHSAIALAPAAGRLVADEVLR